MKKIWKYRNGKYFPSIFCFFFFGQLIHLFIYFLHFFPLEIYETFIFYSKTQIHTHKHTLITFFIILVIMRVMMDKEIGAGEGIKVDEKRWKEQGKGVKRDQEKTKRKRMIEGELIK